jgi:hypothetical protein
MLIMRSLWLERNARVFDGVRLSASLVAQRMKLLKSGLYGLQSGAEVEV